MRRQLLELLRSPLSGRPLHLDVVLERDDEVLFGVLGSEGLEHPIVSGIPLLLPGHGEVVELVRQRRLREATAVGALRAVPRSRLGPFLDAASSVARLRPVSSRVARVLDARRVARDVARLFPTGNPADQPADPLAEVFLAARPPNPDGYRYFRYRLGTPRHLVALGLLESLALPSGPVLDVGCGAGQVTWSIARRDPTALTVGTDISLAQLLAARAAAPEIELVCADARALPFAPGAFDRVVSSDVLSYVPEKPSAASEIRRVLAPAGVAVLTALRNRARRDHVHPGEPLGADAWSDLLAPLPHRLVLSDDALLASYLRGEGAGAATGDAGTSQTVSVLASATPLAVSDAPWDEWPHGRGPLAVHPVMARVGLTEYERRFPSATFERDNPAMREYLPERCEITGADLRGPATGRLGELLASVVVLGQPTSAG